MEATDHPGVDARPNRDVARGVLALALALAPALAALAVVPEFTTQDGPAHLYSARILNASLAPPSPFEGTFTVAWQPLPNWAGHLATMAAIATLSPSAAGRAITALTLVALAAAVVWLRWVVAGGRGLWVASILAVLLAMNVTWLLGFTSFLLGAALVPITLGVWWGGREWFGPGRALVLAILLVVGYFCHPIGLGLAVGGLGVLAIATPGIDRGRRAAWTGASFLPMVPLGLVYRSLTRAAGGLEPTWEHLSDPWSVRAWIGQIGWADPISLASKVYRPFATTPSGLNGLISPALWTLAGLALLAVSTRRRGGERQGWLVLSGLLLASAFFGPDTLGVKHGHYLPQRVALIGLVALVPWLDLGTDRWAGRLGAGILGVALAIQSAFVWDYAFACRDRVGPILRAGEILKPPVRLATLLVDIKGRFRSNPLLHADCMIGARSDVVVWTNYETAHYYFPVKVRPGLDHPDATDFEKVAIKDSPGEAGERARLWSEILGNHGRSIDAVLEWGGDPGLDATTARDYRLTTSLGPVRVWSRREAP